MSNTHRQTFLIGCSTVSCLYNPLQLIWPAHSTSPIVSVCTLLGLGGIGSWWQKPVSASLVFPWLCTIPPWPGDLAVSSSGLDSCILCTASQERVCKDTKTFPVHQWCIVHCYMNGRPDASDGQVDKGQRRRRRSWETGVMGREVLKTENRRCRSSESIGSQCIAW